MEPEGKTPTGPGGRYYYTELLLQSLVVEHPISMEQPISTKKHVPTRKPTSSSKPIANIHAYKKRSKIPIKDIQLRPQTVKLQGEFETLQHEVLDLKGLLVVLEVDKHTWEEEKWKNEGKD